MADHIPEEDKKKNKDNLEVGARGGAVAFGLKISNTALAFVNQIILARILGADSFGDVVLAITVIRIASQIAKFGMEEAMMKFIPRYIDQGDDVRLKGSILFALKFCVLLSIAFMALIIPSSRFIALEIFNKEQLMYLLPIIAIAIPAWSIRDVVGGILRGYKDAQRAFIPEALVSPAFKIVIFLLLTVQDVSPLFAVIAFAAGEVLAVIFSIFFLLGKMSPVIKLKGICDRKEIMDVAYTVIFTSMSVLFYTQADIWILGMFRPSAAVATYNIAAKLVLLVYFPMYAFAYIIPPLISSIHATGDKAELKKMVSESTRWILSMAVPILLVLALEGHNIITYIYGAEYAAGYIPLLILVAGQLVKASAGLIGVILQMTGNHKIYMKVTMVWAVINIALNIVLVPRYGMIGVATATAICLSMVDIISIFIIRKRLSILTLARGFSFDIIFMSSVLALYLLIYFNNLYMGQHVLLLGALAVYLWKSFYNHDIPWKMLLSKNRQG